MRRNGRSHPGASERVDVRLGRFASDGTIRVEAAGRRITVESGIPTELVRLALTGKGNHWRGEVVAVLEEAPERAIPRCPVVAICGGCEWQHLDQAGQLKHKAAIVRRLLSAQRLPTRVDEIVAMPDPWHYRVRAQIALGKVAGFRELRSKRIVRLPGCPVVHPLIERLLEQINRLLRLNQIPDFGSRVLLHAQVVGTEANRELQLTLESVGGLVALEADALMATAEALAAQRGVRSVAALDADGQPRALVGDLMAPVEVAGRTYLIPAGSFFQSNLQLLPALLDRVRKLAGLAGNEAVADLYGGVGFFGLALSDTARHVTVVEIDPRATEAGRRTARLWGRTNVGFLAAPAEQTIGGLPELDVVVVDPPRTGLDRAVLDALIARAPSRIIYVSCNAATWARDAASLVRAGFRVDHLSLWDFYPQTAHVEVVARFSRGGSAAPPFA